MDKNIDYTGIVDIATLSPSQLNEGLNIWSEGDSCLKELLSTCIKNEIMPCASCIGHESKNKKPYIGIDLKRTPLSHIRNILFYLSNQQDLYMTTGTYHISKVAKKALYIHTSFDNKYEIFKEITQAAKENPNKILRLPLPLDTFYNSIVTFATTNTYECDEYSTVQGQSELRHRLHVNGLPKLIPSTSHKKTTFGQIIIE